MVFLVLEMREKSEFIRRAVEPHRKANMLIDVPNCPAGRRGEEPSYHREGQDAIIRLNTDITAYILHTN